MGRGEKKPDGDFRVSGFFRKCNSISKALKEEERLSIAELTHLHTQRKKRGRENHTGGQMVSVVFFFFSVQLVLTGKGFTGTQVSGVQEDAVLTQVFLMCVSGGHDCGLRPTVSLSD